MSSVYARGLRFVVAAILISGLALTAHGALPVRAAVPASGSIGFWCQLRRHAGYRRLSEYADGGNPSGQAV